MHVTCMTYMRKHAQQLYRLTDVMQVTITHIPCKTTDTIITL